MCAHWVFWGWEEFWAPPSPPTLDSFAYCVLGAACFGTGFRWMISQVVGYATTTNCIALLSAAVAPSLRLCVPIYPSVDAQKRYTANEKDDGLMASRLGVLALLPRLASIGKKLF